SSGCRLIFWWLSRLSPTLVDDADRASKRVQLTNEPTPSLVPTSAATPHNPLSLPVSSLPLPSFSVFNAAYRIYLTGLPAPSSRTSRIAGVRRDNAKPIRSASGVMRRDARVERDLLAVKAASQPDNSKGQIRASWLVEFIDAGGGGWRRRRMTAGKRKRFSRGVTRR
ncbi:hypothetical protein ALC56_11880, partial [Trachymyrmex septentrionalis]